MTPSDIDRATEATIALLQPFVERIEALTNALTNACDGWQDYAERIHRCYEHGVWPGDVEQTIAELRRVIKP